MKTDRLLAGKLALVLLPILLTFGAKGAIAQIMPASDGTGTVVKGTQQLNITGGTQAGGNLFHSFQQFGVNAGQTANFLSNPNTQNILGRVTGGNASLINGLLQVSGSNANLYLINPSGIVFGQNASLNVPAAFTATTANGIGFGNGQWFNAAGSNNYGALTGNPNSFGFVGLSGSLINAGNLSVKPGQSIALVGGTVVNTGTISAPGGNITIAAIPGEKLVRIGQDGTILSLDLPMSDKALINAPTATPLSLPALLTGGSIPNAMGVVVEDGVVKLTAGSATIAGNVSADGVGNQNGGTVLAYADNRLNFTGTISAKGGELGGNGGFVDTSGKGQIDIAPNAKVVTTAANGLTGTWLIDPTDLEVVAGTGGLITAGLNDQSLAASTIGAGTIVTALNGTNVNLQATNSITVNAAINASANVSGGNLTLTAPTANLNQAIALKTGSTLSGTATTVNVGAIGTVQNGVDVAATNATVNLAAATYTLGQTVVINKNLTVKGAGQTNTIVSGNGQVGVFKTGVGTTTAFNDLKIAQGNNNNMGGGGGIEGNGALTLTNTTVSDNKAGINGGGIYNNGTVSLINSTISKNTTTGNAGGIAAAALTLIDSTVSENKAGDNGGGIVAFNTISLTNSTVSGNTAASSGGGVYSSGIGAISLTNSTVSGNTAASSGGGIFGNGGGTITGSTITNNTAKGTSLTTGGGGIYRTGGTFTIANSIVAGNIDLGGFTPDLGSNTAGVGFTNSGNNLIGVDAKLTPLGDYGGPTQTHALLPGSLAINAGNATSGPLDQRGKSRVGIADIGAFESQGFTLVTSAGTPQNKTVNQNFTTPLTVKVVANNPIEPVTGGVVNFTAPSSTATATLSASTATIDASGNANVTATANTRIGTYTVKANILGITPTADFNLTNTADLPNSIATTSGSGQTTTVDQNFADNLVATVTDKFGNPVQGSTVTFSLPGSGASGVFGSNTAVTDVDGKASIVIKANTKSGSFTTTGKVGTVTTGADFNLTNLADVANSIATTSGSGQTTTVDQNFSNNLVATVTDKFGNPVQGSTVTFSVPGSGASGILGSNTAVTDVDGKASIVIKANTKSGSFTTTGKVGTVITGANFNLTNLADVANSIVTTSGSGQTTTVDQNFASNLVATVTDQFGNPVQGSTVTFSVPGSGASGILGSNNPLTTNAAGEVSIGIKANKIAGSFTTTGKVGTVTTGADFNLTNTADLPNSIVTTSGSGQTTTVDQNFASNLVATVTDQFGNPVKGSTVTFSLPTTTGANGVFVSNTAVTDADGKASIGIKANTKSGSFTTTGKVDTVTTGANFNLTNLADVANSIATTSGSGQTTTVDQNFAKNLVATVTDKFGNPVQGSTVTFSLPTTTGANGVFVSNTAVTDADGKASIVIKANTKSGSFTTTGKVGTIATGADFNLTNTADLPNSIATTSGSGQTATVDQNFADNLVATVTDKFGNPVKDSMVTFSVPGSGASGVFVSNTAVTDAAGKVSIVIKANTKSGSFTTTGKVGTVTTGADFNLTNLADVANSIATTSGSGQIATVDQNFASNLVATVTDKFGNPVQGSTVTFSVPGSGASGVFVSNTAVTDAAGKVSIVIKANTKSGSFTTTGKVGTVITGANFNLINTADVANSIVTTSGSGQTTTVDQNFASNLVATVTDQFGNPVQGSKVTFSLPTTTGANGVFVSNTAVTDADGKASIVIKANTKSGSFTTTGKVGTIVTGADFNLTNLADLPNSIVTTSGSGQIATVDQNFASNLVATVTDKFGNPVKDSMVTFSVPGSGASGVFVSNTAVTDAAGKVSIGIKANTKSGSFTTTGKVGTVTTGANFNLINTADVANSIVTTSGSGQTRTVDQNFANNLVATVTDKFGNPVQGSTVTFSVPGSGASGILGSNNPLTTNAAGEVSIGIKANTKSGSFTTTGKVGTIAIGANFTLTNTADLPDSIVTTSGSGQIATVDQNFASNLVATVTDQFGNPVKGSTVTFSLPTTTGANGVFVSNSAVTDADGKASIVIKANTKPGSFTTTGKVGTVTTGADFKLTNIADVASLIVASGGSGQTTTVDQNFSNNLVATVTDKFGNPIAGSTVIFSVPGSGASGILGSNNPLITNAAGEVSIGIKANTKSGSFTATGKIESKIESMTAGANFTLTNTADVPNSIATTSGSGQTTTVGQNFAKNLVATVTDRFGNPVQGSTVTFSLPTTTGANGVFGSNTAVTDADGKASIVIKANTKPGSFTSTGKVDTLTTSADFTLTNLTGAASSIVTTSGSGQTTTVDQNFANNLVATVTDKFGNPIAGSTVTFSVPGSGASGVFVSNTAVTDAAGTVSIGIKANTKSGAFRATGKVDGVTTGADFNLTSTADAANSIVTSGGSNQLLIISQRSTQALQTQILDRFGNPVPNTSVTFILPIDGASGSFTNGSNRMTATTNADGIAILNFIANSVSGTYNAIAQIELPTGLKTTQFTLTNSIKMPYLELKETPKSAPTIVPIKSILCAVREAGASVSDAYKGLSSCGGSSIQGKSIAPQSRRSDR